MKTILVIDDCSDYREIITTYLLDADYHVVVAACPDDAFQLLAHTQVDLILCDLLMPFALGAKGFDFDHSHDVGVKTMEEFAWVFPGLPIIAMSAAPSIALEEFVRGLEVGRLCKPFHKSELLSLVRVSLEAVREVPNQDERTIVVFDA